MTYIFLAIGLTVGNLVYQRFQGNPDYMIAFERSYFQAFAILGCWLIVSL